MSHVAYLGFEGEVKPSGNGAHVVVPKEWIGRRVVVLPFPTEAGVKDQ